jgi:hypothetical protein
MRLTNIRAAGTRRGAKRRPLHSFLRPRHLSDFSRLERRLLLLPERAPHQAPARLQARGSRAHPIARACASARACALPFPCLSFLLPCAHTPSPMRRQGSYLHAFWLGRANPHPVGCTVCRLRWGHIKRLGPPPPCVQGRRIRRLPLARAGLQGSLCGLSTRDERQQRGSSGSSGACAFSSKSVKAQT